MNGVLFYKKYGSFLIAIFFIHVRMDGNFYIKPRESPRCIQAAQLVSSIGEVTELVERARLEIECASKGYRGFESPPLRLTNAFGEKTSSKAECTQYLRTAFVRFYRAFFSVSQSSFKIILSKPERGQLPIFK